MFQLNGKSIAELVQPYDKCIKNKDGFFGISIHPDNLAACIAAADEALEKEIPFLPISKYLLYSKTGNRSEFESLYFSRRNIMLKLTAGEVADGKKGKYLSKIMDIMWAILEEETWVIPAHNPTPHKINAPFEFDEIKTLDIFSAATAGVVSVVYHYLKDEFEKEIPEYFNKKILLELDRRIIKPFLSDYSPKYHWKGLAGTYVNNWNPWIVSNILTMTSLAVTDTPLRTQIVERACLYLNNFFKFTFDDGACIEGMGYYFASNAVIFDIYQEIFDLTDGKCNKLDDDYLARLLEYAVNMYAGNGGFFSVNDSPTSLKSSKPNIYLQRMATTTKNPRLLALNNLIIEIGSDETDYFKGSISFHSARFFRNLSEVTKKADIDTDILGDSYCENLQQMVLRGKKFTLFSKAANNHEPHGHNDCGEFIIRYKGNPLFIDPGSITYTAKTFSDDRDEVWSSTSRYHNTPILNGYSQEYGFQGDFNGKYRATNVEADLEKGIMSMELKEAYPDDNGIISCVRTTTMKDDIVTVTDNYEFETEGEYTFNLISIIRPEIAEGSLVFSVGTNKIICEFNSNYKAAIEERKLEDNTTRNLWQQEAIYRITITKLAKKDTFTMKIYEE